MKKYLFYTTSGFTQDENLKEIENCQILGFAEGLNGMLAYENLIKTNSYLKEYQYNTVFAHEIIGEPISM